MDRGNADVRPARGCGAVGARLYYPDGTLQHGGIILGLGGIAGHAQLGISREDPGYAGRGIFCSEFKRLHSSMSVSEKKRI